MSFRFQFRRGTTAERNAANPILAAGEPAVVLDSGQPAKLVLGDGVTAMADLPLIGDLPTKSTALRVTNETPFASRRITSPATIVVMGVDPSTPGRVFGSNRSFGPYTMSNDSGTTWANAPTVPAGSTNTSVQKFVTFKGDLYAMATETATARVGIYRSPNTATVAGWSWTGPLVQTPVGIEGKSTIFNAGADYLFLGEYEAAGTDIAALGGPQLLRSADGVTWETVWGRDPSVKHIHAVYEDPYNAGHVYMTVGDNGTPHSVLRSTEHGATGTWEAIITTPGGANPWQAVQISFSERYVWLASDRRGWSVAVFDRDDLIPYVVALNNPYMMAVPGAPVTTDRFFEIGYFGAVDPATEVFYLNQSDTSTPGNTFGIFFLPQIGSRLELIDFAKTGAGLLVGEVFVANGMVYTGNVVSGTLRLP